MSTTPPCAECKGAADFATLGSSGGQGAPVFLCIACALKLAKRLQLPSLAAAARDAEKRKAARS